MDTVDPERQSLAAWQEALRAAEEDLAAGRVRDAWVFLAELEAEDARTEPEVEQE